MGRFVHTVRFPPSFNITLNSSCGNWLRFLSIVEEHNTESQEDRQDEEATGDEKKADIAPLVLSQEQMEEVSRKLESLEEQVKRLQVRIV